MKNRYLLSVAAAVCLPIICRGGVILAQSPPPPGLVEYLKSRDQPITFEARKLLWTIWGDGKEYTGSKSQNIRLRNLLVADEYAPTLTLAKDVYTQGEQVRLTVGGKQQANGFESDLRLQSAPVKDDTIEFGTAKAGAYGCRVFTEFGSTQAQVLLVPEGQTLRAHLVGNISAQVPFDQAVDLAEASLNLPKEHATTFLRIDEALVNRFFAGLTPALMSRSFRKAGKAYIDDPANQINAVHAGAVCTFALSTSFTPVTAPVASVAWKECGSYIGSAGVEVMTEVMLQAVADHPELTVEEKKKVTEYVKIVRAIKMLTSVRSLSDAKQACDVSKQAFEAMGATAEVVENSKLKLTLEVISDAGNKYTFFVCEIASK